MPAILSELPTMSAMLSFLPFLVERAEMLRIAIAQKTAQEALPKTMQTGKNDCTVSVIVMDGQDWHIGATAPRLGTIRVPAQSRTQAGSCGGP